MTTMKLSECKKFMRRYREIAEAGIVKFDWRTTARWSLRHHWEHEENGRLRDALRHMTERLEDRASEAAACHDIMAECRNIAGDPHTSTVDAVRGLLARAEQAEAALEAVREKWQIATSDDLPTTVVMAVVQDGIYRKIVRAKYIRKFSVRCSDVDYEGDAEYDEGEDEYYWPAGWYEWNSTDETHWMLGDTITHWMALPELPEVQP